MSKLFVARVFAYETPSAEARGKASVGMSVASKLNGNAHWVGTYVEGREDDRKIGFVTAPTKFSSLEKAEEYADKMAKMYKRGDALNPREWGWGEPIEGMIHEVLYKGTDVSSNEAATADRGTTATITT